MLAVKSFKRIHVLVIPTVPYSVHIRIVESTRPYLEFVELTVLEARFS